VNYPFNNHPDPKKLEDPNSLKRFPIFLFLPKTIYFVFLNDNLKPHYHSKPAPYSKHIAFV